MWGARGESAVLKLVFSSLARFVLGKIKTRQKQKLVTVNEKTTNTRRLRHIMADPNATDVATPSLAKLSDVGAGLLGDPEKHIRAKAAALADIEADSMSEAFKTAGCANLRRKQDDDDHDDDNKEAPRIAGK